MTIIPPTEIFFQPDIQTNEQIATAHFFDLQFGVTSAPVTPGNRNDGPSEAAHNGFQRQFDGQVKMRGEERLTTFDHLSSIRFERVGRVVEFDTEEQAKEVVGEAIHKQFYRWIVDDSSAFDEAASK